MVESGASNEPRLWKMGLAASAHRRVDPRSTWTVSLGASLPPGVKGEGDWSRVFRVESGVACAVRADFTPGSQGGGLREQGPSPRVLTYTRTV